jgi:hypothetical protein
MGQMITLYYIIMYMEYHVHVCSLSPTDIIEEPWNNLDLVFAAGGLPRALCKVGELHSSGIVCREQV